MHYLRQSEEIKAYEEPDEDATDDKFVVVYQSGMVYEYSGRDRRGKRLRDASKSID